MVFGIRLNKVKAILLFAGYLLPLQFKIFDVICPKQ